MTPTDDGRSAPSILPDDVSRAALIACYHSGQMSEAQWQRHCEEDGELENMARWDDAVAREREACAKIAEEAAEKEFTARHFESSARRIAAAIRARKG